MELEFGTPRGLEQYVRERFPGRIVRMMYDTLSGPGRLKSGGRTSQAEGSENGPDRLKSLEGGPDLLKVLRVVQMG